MKKTTLILLLLSILWGCGGEKEKEITEVRSVDPAPESAVETPSVPKPIAPSNDTKSTGRFQWELPDGWTAQPPTPMRAANFALAASPDSECYISVLAGTGGGVEANINRWQQQMAQPALSPEEIAALPVLSMLGQSGTYVEITGRFRNMRGEAQSDYMMLGVVCPLGNETVFVKMTGPAAVIQEEKENFKALCSSLQQESNSSP